MPKFRKKPVEIEAVRCADVMQDGKHGDLPAWCRKALRDRELFVFADAVDVHTRNGTVTAEPTDWICCGVEGELYPCADTIFAVTYDPVP